MDHNWTSQDEAEMLTILQIIERISSSLDSRIMTPDPELVELRKPKWNIRLGQLRGTDDWASSSSSHTDLMQTVHLIAQEDDVATLRDMIEAGTLTPNTSFGGYPLLRMLCGYNAHSCVAFLLQSPSLDVNAGSYTALSEVAKGTESMRLLLRDPRLCPNKRNRENHSPFFTIINKECVKALKIWAASGRPFHVRDDDLAEARSRLDLCLSYYEEKVPDSREILTLLENMHKVPHTTRYNLRLELGNLQYHAAFTFAVVVFLCDGLFEFARDVPAKAEGAYRFLTICQKLPLELQILLCLRSVGSGADNIEAQQREEAFRFLGYQLEHHIDSDLE